MAQQEARLVARHADISSLEQQLLATRAAEQQRRGEHEQVLDLLALRVQKYTH
jgi:hypothetical protein